MTTGSRTTQAADPVPVGSRAATALRRRYPGWALVTGASDGLGRELARRLAAGGFDVVLVARRRDRLEALARSLHEDHGVEALVVPADLGLDSGVESLLRRTDGLDVGLVILAAGFGSAGALLDADLEEQRAMLRLNAEASLVLAHHYGRRLRDRGNGAIVLIGSIVGFQGVEGQANYAATKAYVQSLGEALGGELRGSGVDVLVSAPGPIATGFGDRAGMDLRSAAGPDSVAAATLSRVARGGTTYPGLRATLLGLGLRTLPRRVRTRILSRAVAGMRRV